MNAHTPKAHNEPTGTVIVKKSAAVGPTPIGENAEKNIPFTRWELDEVRESLPGQKFHLPNVGPNRRKRRAEAKRAAQTARMEQTLLQSFYCRIRGIKSNPTTHPAVSPYVVDGLRGTNNRAQTLGRMRFLTTGFYFIPFRPKKIATIGKKEAAI